MWLNAFSLYLLVLSVLHVNTISVISKQDLLRQIKKQSSNNRTFQLFNFLETQRDIIVTDYLHQYITPTIASQQLNNIIDIRLDLLNQRIVKDIKPLAAMLSKIGTRQASAKALILMEELVTNLPHPLHFGEIGSLHESMGNYEKAIQYYRNELVTRAFNSVKDENSIINQNNQHNQHNQNNQNNQNNNDVGKKIALCSDQHAWRIQDDLLAETKTIRVIQRIPEAKHLKHSSAIYLEAASSKIDQRNIFVGGSIAVVKMNQEIGHTIYRVQWPWVYKEVVVVEVQRDLILLDAGSATFGILDKNKNQNQNKNKDSSTILSSSPCVVFTRSIEHMEGWRKLSKIKSFNGIGKTASWGTCIKSLQTKQSILLHAKAKDPKSIIVIAMGEFAYNNHFHWIVEVMARLVVFRNTYLMNSNATALLPRWIVTDDVETSHQRVDETLLLLGIPTNRVLSLDPKEKHMRIKAAALIEWRREGEVECGGYMNGGGSKDGSVGGEPQLSQPTPPTPPTPSTPPQCWRKWKKEISPNNLHMPPASVLCDLRDTVEHFLIQQKDTSTRDTSNDRPYVLFVHRGISEMTTRSFVGGQNTIDAIKNSLVVRLPNHDVKAVDPSELSLIEQAKLFQGADVVIGPHGAGLVNVIFCKVGTVVVELPTIEHAGMLFFQDISTALGLRHAIVPSVAIDKEDRYAMSEWDVTVVVETVRLMVELDFKK